MNSELKLAESRHGVFTAAREKLGLSVKELASQACLSARQIEQIENGEMSSFYGAKIKLTAAKKVAKILGLSEEEAFNNSDTITELKTAMALTPEEFQVIDTKAHFESNVRQEKKQDQPQTNKVVEVHTNVTPSILGASRPKQTPNKGTFIWLGLIAVVVFSVINLRPLFFVNKSKEIAVVKEEVIEKPPVDEKVIEPVVVATSVTPAVAPVPTPIVTPLVQAGSDVAAGSEACPASDAIIPSYKTSSPKKSGDMVYVQVKSKQVICIADASGRIQNRMLEPGAGASFYGRPPFKVLSSGLGQLDVYFQGSKVRPENLDGKTILLEASDMTQPVTPADSQLR